LLTLSAVLLFVFWYCHKRGKETRLAKEGQAVEGSESELSDSEILEKHSDDVEPPVKLIEDKPNTADVDLSSILNQPAPAQVPLPQSTERELATPVDLKK
jgi:hypothetical protein